MILFLDLDGTVARFVEGVAQLFGIPAAELHAAEDHGVPLAEACGLSETGWRAIIDEEGPSFWTDLEPYEDALEVWRRVSGLTTVHAKVLSSPGKFAHSASGKLAWCRRHLGPADVTLTKSKHLLARASKVRTVLVDDWAKVCREFCFYGGEAVLMPRHGDGRVAAWHRVVMLAQWWEGRDEDPPVELGR